MSSMTPGEWLVMIAQFLSVAAAAAGAVAVFWRRSSKKQKAQSDKDSKALNQLFNELSKLSGEFADLRESQNEFASRIRTKVSEAVHELSHDTGVVSRKVAALQDRIGKIEGKTQPSSGVVANAMETLRKERADAFTEFRRHMEQFVWARAREIEQHSLGNVARASGVHQQDPRRNCCFRRGCCRLV